MPFGDILSKTRENITLTAADGKKAIIDSNLKRLALKIFGIPHVEMRNRARLIIGNIDIKEGMSLLDAGTGPGLYALSLAYKNKISALGIDLDVKKLKDAEKISKVLNIKNVSFQKADLTKLKLNKKFDRIICSDVLEHIENDQLAINNLSKLLKPNGFILFTFPADTPDSRRDMPLFEHVRPGYTFEMFKDKLERAGMKIDKFQGYTYFFGRIAWKINHLTQKIPALSAIFFYPLYLLSFLDIIKIGSPDGLFFKVSKK
jgi:ubiquinone/menaquinone biosynthesis C-methylase UbiE